jgi:hypothetical protein
MGVTPTIIPTEADTSTTVMGARDTPERVIARAIRSRAGDRMRDLQNLGSIVPIQATGKGGN